MTITRSLSLLLLIASFVMFSCEPEEQAAPVDENGEISESAEEFLAMRLGMSPITAMSAGTGIGSPISESFKQLQRARRKAGRMRSDTIPGDTIPGDTIPPDTIPPDTIGYISCAQVETKFNRDGSITTIVDYGDGCEEGYPPYLQFFFGRHESTIKNDFTYNGTLITNSFYANHKFDHFGGRFIQNGQQFEWSNDGTTTDEGYAQYDSTNNVHTGTFQHRANLTSEWDGQAFTHKGASFTRYTLTESVIERSDFTYTTNDDYYYRVKVLKPLVTKFDCQPTDSLSFPGTIYVSGVESVQYKIGNQHGSFEIHYGNGECDSIVTIVENGKRKKMDLSRRSVIARKD